MTYIRYPDPRENGLRKKIEGHIGSRVFYSWEIANILINLGMDGVYQHLHREAKTDFTPVRSRVYTSTKLGGSPDWPNTIKQIDTKVKRDLKDRGFNSKNLPEYENGSKNGIVLYPEEVVWDYIKECEEKSLVYPIEESSLEEIVKKDYPHRLTR